MDTKFPVLLTIAIGVAIMIFQGSGAVAYLDNAQQQDFASDDVVRNAEENQSIENESAYGGDVAASSESDIVGVILGSVPKLLSLIAIPGVMGAELQTLTPAPWYIAQPIGAMFNIVTYIGGFQLATGREYL